MLSVLLVARPGSALAQNGPSGPGAASEPEATAGKRLGVGYKIGNGLGFVGADVVIQPIPRLSLDLQANWFRVSSPGSSANGYGIAPSIQFHFFEGPGSSPYLGVGYVYAGVSLEGVSASASGTFANLGWDWRWASGLGILLGGGVQYLGHIRATNGVDTIDQPGGAHFNLEVGFRYLFL